jgi:hypothetical protein
MIPALDFVGMTDTALIDEAAKLHTLAKAIEAKLDEAKAIIRSRGMKEIHGTSFKATVGDTVVSWALDKNKITEAMGDAWVTKHSKQIVKAGSVSFKPYVNLGEIIAA